MPEALAIPRAELDLPQCTALTELVAGRRSKVLAKHRLGLLVTAVSAGKGIAHTAPRGQTDIPDPACLASRGPGDGGDGLAAGLPGNLYREGAVVEQDVRHIAKAHAEMSTQQQRAHSRAIHEEIAADCVPRRGAQRGQIAVLCRFDCGDVFQAMLHAQRLRAVLLQEQSELARIQVVTVVEVAAVFGSDYLFWCKVAVTDPGLRRHGLGEGHAVAKGLPVAREIDLGEPPGRGEGVVVALALTPLPVDKLRALLEARIAGFHEVGLRYAHALQAAAHGGPCTFADTDGLYVRRLDQGHADREPLAA